MGVLGEVAESAAEAGGDEVAGVAEKDCCFCGGIFGISPGALENGNISRRYEG